MAAYIAGTALWSKREGRQRYADHRFDVIYSAILAPEDAPAWVHDREQLWNRVEGNLRRKDARLAKVIDAAITRGIPGQDWPELARRYAAQFVKLGMIADVAVHDDGTGHNPHLHVLLTVNQLGNGPDGPDGFGAKLPAADRKAFVVQARTGWATLNNEFLAKAGLSLRVDARSYKARGIQQTPTRHHGRRGPEPAIDHPQQQAERNPMQMGRGETAMTNEREREAEREAAEAAARQQFEENRVKDWFEERVAEDAAHREEREHRAAVQERDDGRPWYEQAADNMERGQQPRREPIRESTPDHIAAERDRLARLEQEPERPEESALRQAVAREPAEVRAEVDAAIQEVRLDRLRARDQQARLERLADNLSPKARQQLERVVRDADREWPQPEPGPYRQPHSPGELAAARERMRQEYERDDERER